MNSVIEDTFLFFKGNLLVISLLTLMVESPFILIDNLNIIGQLPSILNIWIAFIGLAFVFAVVPYSTGAQALLYSQIINGSKLDFKECLVASREQIFGLITSSFLFCLLFLGGLVLFIIPGIIIGARLSYFPFFIVYEKLKPIPALQKSFHVTKDNVWKIAVPVLFFNVVIISSAFLISHLIGDKGLINYILWVGVDCLYAIFGWLSLIVAFRFYCQYKKDTS